MSTSYSALRSESRSERTRGRSTMARGFFSTSTLALVGLVTAAASVAAGDLVVAHINDLHGYLFPTRLVREGTDRATKVGGLFSAATYLRWLRRGQVPGRPPAETEGVLFLDAGDWFGGTLYGAATQGDSVRRAFVDPGLGLDATVPGNHAWDFGSEAFLAFLRGLEGKVAVLCANLLYQERLPPAVQPWKVFRVAGRRIGVLGLITEGALSATLARKAAGWTVSGEEDALRAHLPALRAQSDYVVLLTHVGYSRDRAKLAALLALEDEDPRYEVDLVIDGHSHRSEGFDADPDTHVTQAGAYGQRLGVVRVPLRDEGGFGPATSERVLLDTGAVPQDPGMRRRQGVMVRARDALENAVLVPAEPDLIIHRIGGDSTPALVSPLGDLASRAFRQAAQRAGHDVDFAMAYKGGVRSCLDSHVEGHFEAGDLHQVFPFEEPLVVVEAPGHMLERPLKRGVSQRYHLAYSGLQVEAAPPEGDRRWHEFRSASVGERPFQPDRRYRFVTDEFVASWFRGDEVEKHALPVSPKQALVALLRGEARGEVLTDADVRRLAPPSTVVVPPVR